MSAETRLLAERMIRLEQTARDDMDHAHSAAAYWLTASWRQREEIQTVRSALLRFEASRRREFVP